MSEHFFFDGYDLSTDVLSSVDNMEKLLNIINKKYFSDKGVVKLIPYFDGKIEKDGGVSGIILGKNKHFTCHTFCYRHAMFVDYFGKERNFDGVLKELLSIYDTKNYDLCDKNINIDGNFGKHMIFNKLNPISFDSGKKLIEKILCDIEMTPINDVIINYIDDEHYDLLQPIAESHISIHRKGNNMVLDAFSCKWFDETKLASILNSFNYEKVCRGVKYK